MSAPGTLNKRNFYTVISAAILVGTETVGIGLASGWAFAGMLGLGTQGTYICEALFGSLGIFALWIFYKKAIQIEPIRN
jgi:hypothetical protein